MTHDPPGPREPDELGELTDDAVTGHYRLYQRKRGHRYSLDDVLTAYQACEEAPGARRCLELGTGIGSVLHMLAHALPEAHFWAVEAQRNSYALLERNVARNALGARVTTYHDDFRRRVTQDMEGAPFDLVTGTPPYVPPSQATPSSDSQRAYARQEFRGGVEAYVEAAARVLAPDGVAVICGDARTPERVERAAASQDLRVVLRRDAIPRAESKGALFSVHTLVRAERAEAEARVEAWVARDAAGARTKAYCDVRAYFGLPCPEDEAPSP